MRNSFLPLLMELSFGNRETMPSRAWPVLEPGGTWGEGEQVFKAVEPGVFRFEDQWLEVVPSLAESVPEVLSSDELLQSMGGEFSSYRASGQEEGSGKEEREPLWLWFAIVAASLLIIEMIWSRPARGAITKGDSAHA
jgi:hypothetical protein